MNPFEQILAVIAELQKQVVELQAAKDQEIALLKEEHAAALVVKYDEGFAAGVKSVQEGQEKIYSQAELDEKLALKESEVKNLFLPQIAELEGKVAELVSAKEEIQNKFLALEAGIPVMVADAVKAAKLEVIAKIEEVKKDDEALILELKASV